MFVFKIVFSISAILTAATAWNVLYDFLGNLSIFEPQIEKDYAYNKTCIDIFVVPSSTIVQVIVSAGTTVATTSSNVSRSSTSAMGATSSSKIFYNLSSLIKVQRIDGKGFQNIDLNS